MPTCGTRSTWAALSFWPGSRWRRDAGGWAWWWGSISCWCSCRCSGAKSGNGKRRRPQTTPLTGAKCRRCFLTAGGMAPRPRRALTGKCSAPTASGAREAAARCCSGCSPRGCSGAELLEAVLLHQQALEARLVNQVVGPLLAGEEVEGDAPRGGHHLRGFFEGQVPLADDVHHQAHAELQAAQAAGFFGDGFLLACAGRPGVPGFAGHQRDSSESRRRAQAASLAKRLGEGRGGRRERCVQTSRPL